MGWGQEPGAGRGGFQPVQPPRGEQRVCGDGVNTRGWKEVGPARKGLSKETLPPSPVSRGLQGSGALASGHAAVYPEDSYPSPPTRSKVTADFPTRPGPPTSPQVPRGSPSLYFPRATQWLAKLAEPLFWVQT